jgi:hypothetical protein
MAMEYRCVVQLSSRILRVLGAFGPQTGVQVAQRMDPPVLECRVLAELESLRGRGWVALMPDGKYASLDVRYRPRSSATESFYARVAERALHRHGVARR